MTLKLDENQLVQMYADEIIKSGNPAYFVYYWYNSFRNNLSDLYDAQDSMVEFLKSRGYESVEITDEEFEEDTEFGDE